MKDSMKDRIEAALALPVESSRDGFYSIGEVFDPWEQIIARIHGSYSSQCDDLMIETMEAVRDGTTSQLMDKHGFSAEFMLYVLSGHGLTDYGTSPRHPWPMYRDLWQPLIDKWKAYRKVQWEEE